MDKPYFLALDYGTQSVRAIIFDKNGNIHTKVQSKVEPFIANSNGAAEQLPEYCYQQLVNVIKQLLLETEILPKQIACLSITTQRACTLLLDKKQQPISPLYMWSDTRLATQENLKPMSWYFQFTFRVIGFHDRIKFLRQTAKVNYLAEHQGELLKSADKVVLLSGFLLSRITGKLTDSVASQVAYLPFEYKDLTWANKHSWRWQALECTFNQMMPLTPAAKLVGDVSEQFAKETGLDVQTKVATAGADKACEMFATGSGEEGVANISLGSAASISIGLETYQETIRFMPSFPSLAEGQYMNEIQLERGFWLLTWLIEQFGDEDVRKAAELNVGVEEYICSKIQEIEPGCSGLLLSPTWSQGVIFPGPEARGSIIGFTPKHTRYHLYRAAIEGILFTLKAALMRLEKKHKYPVQLVRISGGGSQSEQVLQMAADILEKPVEVITTPEASALGAAMCSAVATKCYPDLFSARKVMMKVSKRYLPQSEHNKTYQCLFRSHAKIYNNLKSIFKTLS
ncbi:carbohydrate kinase [Parashewanella curva]|uniref:Carbohydrate kinase n=1 Tax=Parashewanella curva TaxID=2338552 RepID=A0A3L8Q2J8_9GAMM|nr:FGGY-family carbohydrate kinase [Parashewanella curva]RLV61073.1 carbohydrate kinase [Parashewanella curva]